VAKILSPEPTLAFPDFALAIFATADHAFSAEQLCTRISPNNAMTLSGNEWLWPAKRA